MIRNMILVSMLGVSLYACKDDSDSETASGGDFTLKGAGSEDDAALRLATSGIDPETLNIKLYSFAVSENEDCSDMIELYSDDSPEETNMLEGPEFGQSALEDGTYKCIAYKMSDTITVSPAEDSDNGACEAGEEFELEICRGNDDEGAAGVHWDDEEFSCSEGEEDIITFYVSTISESFEEEDRPEECQSGEEGADTAACTSFRKPSEDKVYRGLTLENALVKSGAVTGYIVVDGTGQVSEREDENDTIVCEMEEPSFSFVSSAE